MNEKRSSEENTPKLSEGSNESEASPRPQSESTAESSQKSGPKSAKKSGPFKQDRLKSLIKKGSGTGALLKSGASKYLSNVKEQLPNLGKNLRNQITQNLRKEKLGQAIKDFDPQAALSWITQTIQKSKSSFYGILVTLILSTYFLADLTALLIEGFIPEPPASGQLRADLANLGRSDAKKTIADYNEITVRNLFNSKGLLPGEGSTKDGSVAPDLNAPAVKTTLPLNLIGTVIMEDPMKSIATIEDKSISTVYPVRVEDEIPDKAKILTIEPHRVTFINRSSGRPEFVELPEEFSPQPHRISLGNQPSSNVERVSATQFNVNRTEVDRALADFNNILTQARAVPNFENGLPAGYKLFQIVPGSIYDKLGLQNGDVIAGLNGESINDPAKAFEMLSELKRSNHLELQVKKDGRQLTYTYDIR